MVIPPRAVPLMAGFGGPPRHLNKEEGSPMKKVPVVKITTPDVAASVAGLPFQATVAPRYPSTSRVVSFILSGVANTPQPS